MLVFNAIKFTCLLLDFNVSGEDIKVGMIQNYFRYIPKHFLIKSDRMKRSSVVQNVEKLLVSASFLTKKEFIEV